MMETFRQTSVVILLLVFVGTTIDAGAFAAVVDERANDLAALRQYPILKDRFEKKAVDQGPILRIYASPRFEWKDDRTAAYLFSSTDGKKLMIDLTPPIDWNMLDLTDRTHADNLAALFFLNGRKNDDPSTEKMLPVVLDWIRANSKKYEGGKKTKDRVDWSWMDTSTTARFMRFCYFFVEVYPDRNISDENIRTIYDSLVQHIEFLSLRQHVDANHNHGFFHLLCFIAGLEYLKTAFPDLPCENIRKDAIAFFREVVDNRFTADAVLKEHSPGYHFTLYNVMKHFVEKRPPRELVSYLDEHILNMEKYLYYATMPNGVFAGFGDTYGSTPCLLKHYHSAPKFSLLLAGLQGELSDDCAREHALGLFPRSGYVAYKDNHSYLGMQSAFFSPAHKHADHQTIIWYDEGQVILSDAGTATMNPLLPRDSFLRKEGHFYASPQRIHVESTRAHNTVEINGRNHVRVGKPYGSGTVDAEDDGEVFRATGIVPHADAIHLRQLIFKPGKHLVVVDRLEPVSEKKNTYRQYFTLPPELLAVTDGKGQTDFKVPLSEGKNLYIKGFVPDGTLLGCDQARGMPEKIDLGTGENLNIEQLKDIRGWVSRGGDFIPTTSLCFRTESDEPVTFVTIFDIADIAPENFQVKKNDNSVIDIRWDSSGKSNCYSVDCRIPAYVRAPMTSAP